MVVQNVFDGLVLGSIFVLGAIGLTLIYSIRNFPNFAHGDLMTVGAYVALVFNASFVSFFAVPTEQLWIALLAATAISMAILAGMGLFLEWTIFRKMHGESLVLPLIASIGLAFVLQNIVRVVWGSAIRNYGFPAQVAQVFFGIRVLTRDITILGAAFALVLAVHLILKYTTLGKAMRASADNFDLARVTGINVQRVIHATWIMSAGLAAAAGVLLGLFTVVRPIMGFNVLLPIFAAVILGGIGSPYGAMVGGLLIGVSQEASVPLLFWLSRSEVVLGHAFLTLGLVGAVFVVPGVLVYVRALAPRRIATILLGLGGTIVGLATLLVALAVTLGWDLTLETAIFWEMGLQQPAAFKRAVPFIILVLALLFTPHGLAGLIESPRFRAAMARAGALSRKGVAAVAGKLRSVVR